MLINDERQMSIILNVLNQMKREIAPPPRIEPLTPDVEIQSSPCMAASILFTQPVRPAYLVFYAPHSKRRGAFRFALISLSASQNF